MEQTFIQNYIQVALLRSIVCYSKLEDSNVKRSIKVTQNADFSLTLLLVMSLLSWSLAQAKKISYMLLEMWFSVSLF